MKGILINNGKALGDGSGKVFTVQSEKGNPVTVYTEGEMDSLIIAENVDKIFKYVGDDGDYTKDHVYQVVDENGTLTVKDLSMGIPLPPVTNIQLDSSGVLSWDAPDTTELVDKLVSINYKINFNGNELTTAKNLISVYSFAVEGQNEASVQAIFTLSLYNEETQSEVEFEMTTEPIAIVLETTLPRAMKMPNAVAVGEKAYIFGVTNDYAIYVFDTTNDSIYSKTSMFSSHVEDCMSAAVGTNIYVLGSSSLSYRNRIYKFDTITEKTTRLGTDLPVNQYKAGCASVGTNIYIFGGREGFPTTIVKFDTTTETITTLETQLPTYRVETNAVTVGEYIYVFDGTTEPPAKMKDIVKFNSTTETIEVLEGVLQYNNYTSCATAIGNNIYIIGGTSPHHNRISVFDTISETATTLEIQLPINLISAAAVTINNNIYTFGGTGSTNTILKVINLS